MQPIAHQKQAQEKTGRGIFLSVSRRFVSFVVLGLWVHPVSAQSSVSGKFISRAWTTSDGLPHDSVTSVLQSHDGFLWVGTQGGLARFDGVTFKKLSFPGAEHGDLWITDLCEDQEGRLYIGTEKEGLLCYTGNKLTRLGDRRESITSLAVGSGGELWIGGRNGLSQWDGKKFRSFTLKDGLPEETVASVYTARSGKVWITLRSGVYLMTSGRIEKYHLNAESQSRTPEFLGVYEDEEHELWAFGDTYLIKLPEGKRFNYFHSGHLPSVRIWSFHEGRDGRLWIGTSGQGLFQFTDQRFRPVEMQSGKRPSNVRSICEDFEGNLWLGTDGGGLVQLRQEQLRHLGAAEGLPTSSALCIIETLPNNVLISYADGSLFLGSRDHFEPYRLLDPTETQPFARSLCTTPAGDIWIASSGLGVSCLHGHRRVGFSSANGLSANFISYICASPEGTVFAGARSGDIYRYNEEGWQLSGHVAGGVTAMLAQTTNQVWVGTSSGCLWHVQSSNSQQVLASAPRSSAYIGCLSLDSAGRLWAGSYGAGVRCYDPSAHEFWSAAEEPQDQRICGLVFDTQGNIWLTTPDGILLGTKRQIDEMINGGQTPNWQRVAHLDENDPGLPGGPKSLLSGSGLLWSVVGGRVMVLDPRTAMGQSPPEPVYVESVRVNNRELRYQGSAIRTHGEGASGSVRLTPSVRALDFEFTSPCLTMPEKARFRCKLEGFESDWVECNPVLRRAHYGPIPPGDYCFRVRASGADGTWSPAEASFAFRIPTPVWRTRWAVFSYVVSLAAMVYMSSRLIFHRRLRHRLVALEQSEEMSRERMRIAQDMHDQIGSKLARISYLTEAVKTELKSIYANTRVMDSLAKTARDLLRSLDQMVWAVNPRNDSIEQLAVYLCRYASDYFQDTSILCELRVPEHLPAAPLSAEVRHNVLLAFEEVLTNAMKHSGADRIVVELTCEPRFAQIIVSDNGRGFDPASLGSGASSRNVRIGQGIPGLKRRLQALGGQCHITSSFGQGTKIIFLIPITTQNARYE